MVYKPNPQAGGNNDEFNYDAFADQRKVELWNPSTGAWTAGPAQVEYRTYHSTALLLPDGRVMSAGDDFNGGNNTDTAEIYSPPYLYKGTPAGDLLGAGRRGLRPELQRRHDERERHEGRARRARRLDPRQRHDPAPRAAHAQPAQRRREPHGAGQRAPSRRPATTCSSCSNSSGVPSVAKFVQVGQGGGTTPTPTPARPRRRPRARTSPSASRRRPRATRARR